MLVFFCGCIREMHVLSNFVHLSCKVKTVGPYTYDRIEKFVGEGSHMAHERKAWKKSWYDLTICAPIENFIQNDNFRCLKL
jgi:hypothetical protein